MHIKLSNKEIHFNIFLSSIEGNINFDAHRNFNYHILNYYVTQIFQIQTLNFSLISNRSVLLRNGL